MTSAGADDNVEEALCLAAERLAGKGLILPGDTVSQRLPEQDAFALVQLGAAGQAPRTATLFGLGDGQGGLHQTLYAARPDVGAILAGSQHWARALARLDRAMPAIFDEQVRHLGLEVRRLAARASDLEPARVAAGGFNAFVLDDVTLCFGMGLERLLLNAELLEKCAKAFVLAQCAGGRVRRIPWLVRTIANRRLVRDEKEAATSHLRGERAVMKAGY